MKLGKHHSEADAAQCYVSIGAYEFFSFTPESLSVSPNGDWWYYSSVGRCTLATVSPPMVSLSLTIQLVLFQQVDIRSMLIFNVSVGMLHLTHAVMDVHSVAFL